MFVFEWDENKARINLKKHSVSFEEAQSVFLDENARIIPDPEHSDDEDRFVLLGIYANVRLLTVCHCYRQNQKTVRIISARKATNREAKQYQEFL
ncbi:MAG: BrnT family toxin [Candidatus Riflebacteria bacterium]|nr:BrnT family toxin [Candidatus Riflebacteria bacterium]